MLLYIKFIWFCWKLMWKLKIFEDFLKNDGSRGKNHKIEIRNVERKLKSAQIKGEQPKKEHIFLLMFYESLKAENPKNKQAEFETLFSLLWWWHYSLDLEKSESELEEE